MTRSKRGLEMYVVAKRLTGTWSNEERFALMNRFKSLPKRPLPRIQKAQHYLIVSRPCSPAWIASAVRADVPYRVRRELVISRSMLGMPKLPSGDPDVREIIRRFELKLKEPPPKPRKLYTRVSVEHTEHPWNDASVDELLRRMAGRSGEALLYQREGKPERFTFPGRVAWSRVDEFIRFVAGDGARFGYEIVRSQDEPEERFGQQKAFTPSEQ